MCGVFAKMQRLCRGCEQSPHPRTGRRELPEPFGITEQGVGSGGEGGNKTNQGSGRSKRKFFEKILQTSLIQSKGTMRRRKHFQSIVTA